MSKYDKASLGRDLSILGRPSVAMQTCQYNSGCAIFPSMTTKGEFTFFAQNRSKVIRSLFRMMPFRVTSASERANASPTVYLERGDYRVRPHIRRPPPEFFRDQVRPAPRRDGHDFTKGVALLLLLLALAAFTCFGIAYYLFTTRWAYQSGSKVPIEANTVSQVNGSRSLEFEFGISHGEKYITYLPHSGFHNQRIAFENALVLAFALRRTLLVPPVRLAYKPIRYVEYETLARHHELSTKDGLQHCLRVAPYMSQPLECFGYFESSYLPWTWLFDLSVITRRQPLVHLPNVSQRWIHEHFRGDDDIHILRDVDAYQYRFLEDEVDPSPHSDRYSQDIYFSQLAAVQERLLQLGTVFGTSRLRLKKPETLAYQHIIRGNMIFANKELLEVAESISLALGDHFLGVHIRISDGYFKSDAERIVRSIWWQLLQNTLGFSTAEICRMESRFSDLNPNHCSESVCSGNCSTTFSRLSMPLFPPKLKCRTPRHHEAYNLLNVPLYVATDVQDPGSNPAFLLLRRTFPCIFFLGDFPEKTQQLQSLRSPYDGVPLQPFLLPFVDAMVAAKALAFAGTRGSTFSNFVTRLWESYHK